MSGEFAGALNQRVTIEHRKPGRNGLGGGSRDYFYGGAVWASLMSLIPAGLEIGETLSALPRWTVRLRKREDISLATRLVWNGRFLMVRSILSDPAEPARFVLTCEEAR